jgi:hypothetical protein
MRLLPLMLLVVCCSASADWMKLGESAAGESFYDFSTLQRHGRMARIWSMQTFKEKLTDGAYCVQNLREDDCTEHKWRFIQRYRYADPLCSGTYFYSSSGIGDWDYIPPNSYPYKIHELICSK